MTALKKEGTFLVFLATAVAFFFWRSSTGLVYDDTRNLNIILHNFTLWKSAIYDHLIASSFSTILAGYRPLSTLLASVGASFFIFKGPHPSFWVAFIATIHGATAASFYLLSQKILKNAYLSLAALALFIFSAAYQGSAWVIFAGVQALVPLFFVSGILLYFKLINVEKKTPYVAALIGIYAIGPWFREFIGLLPLVIAIHELLRCRRVNWLIIISLLGFLHAIFPSATIHLFIKNTPAAIPVYHMGLLSTQMQDLFNLRWQVPIHMLFLIPPTLFPITFLALFFANPKPVSKSLLYLKTDGSRIRIIYLVCITLSLLAAELTHWSPLTQGVFWLLITLVIPIYAMRMSYLLTIWFLISYLPFLKVYTEEVHLMYALVPASIIVTVAFKDVYIAIKERCRRWQVIPFFFLAILPLLVFDQFLTAIGSYRVVIETNKTIFRVAHWLERAIPKNSVVAMNELHGNDIQLYSNNHFQFLSLKRLGTPKRDNLEMSPVGVSYDHFMRGQTKDHPRYVINIAHNKYTLMFIKLFMKDWALEPIGRIATLSAIYYFVDPLKIFCPPRDISYLGAPDLVEGFYAGPSDKQHLFRRQVFATYNLYRARPNNGHINNRSVTQSSRLIQPNYHGYKIYRDHQTYFAIPQKAIFHPQRPSHTPSYPTYPSWFRARSLNRLKKFILAEKMPNKISWRRSYHPSPE